MDYLYGKGDILIKNITLDGIVGSENPTVKKCCVLDVETEGLNPREHGIIEVTILPFGIDKYNRISEIYKEEIYTSFNDTGRGLSQKITEITGITDEMVKGNKIDFERVRTMLKDFDHVFAHNAVFDMGFITEAISGYVVKSLVCTKSDIVWEGRSSTRLELLCIAHGGFFYAHRSLDDCIATLWLLGENDNLNQAILNSKKPKVKIVLHDGIGSNLSSARGIGFYEDLTRKCWYYITLQEYGNEIVRRVKEKFPDNEVTIEPYNDDDYL
jgi:DNA polymerase-3 subunit epsilon